MDLPLDDPFSATRERDLLLRSRGGTRNASTVVLVFFQLQKESRILGENPYRYIGRGRLWGSQNCCIVYDFALVKWFAEFRGKMLIDTSVVAGGGARKIFALCAI